MLFLNRVETLTHFAYIKHSIYREESIENGRRFCSSVFLKTDAGLLNYLLPYGELAVLLSNLPQHDLFEYALLNIC